MRSSVLLAGCSALCLAFASGCVPPAKNATVPVPALGPVRVLEPTDKPTLFLGHEADAPAVGYASPELPLQIVGRERHGRVPITTLGPIHIRAYVPSALLRVRVQRRGRLRGTPVYVGPNDRVQVLGPAAEAGRVRVAARPVIGGRAGHPFEGTYPAIGLGAEPASAVADPPEAGVPHELAPGKALILREAPRGRVVAEIAPQPQALEVEVVRQEAGFFAVRVGSGPYLVGYTDAPLVPKAARSAVQPLPLPDPKALPKRLLEEQGALKRVSPGTEITFNDEVIGTVRELVWARVLRAYPGGECDVFVALHDGTAVRGLVPGAALSDPEPGSIPAAGAANEAQGYERLDASEDALSPRPSSPPPAPTKAASDAPSSVPGGAISETPSTP